MVESLFHPLNIFILGLGGGFLIPLLYKLGKGWLTAGFVFALGGIAIISAVCLWSLANGAPPYEILTSGTPPPLSINLRLGLWEAVFCVGVNIVAVLGAIHLWPRLKDSYAALLLFLILTMGINGMVMTRDLFNLFVFLEIVSIATYGLLGLERTPAAISASFKYIMATVLASTFFLLGTTLLYHVTGSLSIDELTAGNFVLSGPLATTALVLILTCLLVELKPFPANGWGLDAYETAPGGIAAMMSVGVSAGVFFALFKLLPLFEDQLWLIAASGGVTFVLSNLIGLSQTNVQRMLGYSSIAQMGLLLLALALLTEMEAETALPLVIGGLFVNHLFAKAGLFWLAGVMNRAETSGWSGLTKQPVLLAAFAVLIVAIAGLPPFPGFWAKWELVMQLAAGGKAAWIAVVLVGSLLEIAYMFRWFAKSLRPKEQMPVPSNAERMPVIAAALLLFVGGIGAAHLAQAASWWLFAPILAGISLLSIDSAPGRVKGVAMLVLVIAGGWALVGETSGISGLFAALLMVGGVVVASASLYREDPRPGFHALMAVLILSIAALVRARTNLEFFYSWEIITLASYFLIARGRDAGAHIQRFMLFSMGSAFLLLAGFALAAHANGSHLLAAFREAGPEAATAVALLAAGFLVKAGAVGVHVWLPGAYAEAEDDVSAMLSSVVSKVAMFGLFTVTYMAIRSDVGLELAHVLGWIGMATTLAGALMALGQTDIKRLLACSSMSQLGYIVTAIALMSHLGWVTALYLVANHLMVKGILFLAVAAIVLHTGVRSIDDLGGLARRMPVTFALTLVALVSMSGLPPLMGFGGKWLLLSAMSEKGWFGLVAVGLIATFVGFLYMWRLATKVFLGPERSEFTGAREAPPAILMAQFALVAGIIVLSFYPKLLMDPVSQAIDPYFAATLVWEGMSLETIYGTWNPTPVMLVSLAVAAVLFAIAWSYRRSRQDAAAAARDIYAFYRPALERLLVPAVSMAWTGIGDLIVASAGRIRRIYTGNPQTYATSVVAYLIAIYVMNRTFL